jgi:hypothetical protein
MAWPPQFPKRDIYDITFWVNNNTKTKWTLKEWHGHGIATQTLEPGKRGGFGAQSYRPKDQFPPEVMSATWDDGSGNSFRVSVDLPVHLLGVPGGATSASWQCTGSQVSEGSQTWVVGPYQMKGVVRETASYTGYTDKVSMVLLSL